MSRIEERDCDDTRSFLYSCAFTNNMRQAVAGRKGQRVLQELEEALLALPEKRLGHGVFSKTTLVAGPTGAPEVRGEVCALGALAVHRKVKEGKPRAVALVECNLEVTDDEDDGGQEMIQQAASALGIVDPLAYAIVERNDEYGGETPEETYTKVLAWVQKKIQRGPAWWGGCKNWKPS